MLGPVRSPTNNDLRRGGHKADKPVSSRSPRMKHEACLCVGVGAWVRGVCMRACGCTCVCQGINSNHAQTARFNIPTSTTTANHEFCVRPCRGATNIGSRSPYVQGAGVCVRVCVCWRVWTCVRWW